MHFNYRSSLSFPIQRFFFLKFFLLSIFVLLVGRLCYLHIWNHQFLNHQGNVRYYRKIILEPKRGQIFDKNNVLLAGQKQFYSVWAVPELLRLNSVKQQQQLQQQLSLQTEEWRLKWKSNKKFVYLKRFIDEKTKKVIENSRFSGIHFMTEFKRFYTCEEACSQLIGFTNQQQEGLEGIEKVENKLLSGSKGVQHLIKDIKGHLLADVRPLQEPIHGQNIQLTIDVSLQQYAYKILEETVQKHQATSASVIVIDTRNADIIATTNYPSFDANQRIAMKKINTIKTVEVDNQGDNYKNKSFLDVFEPGSTMKPFTVIAGLKNQVIEPHSIIPTQTLKVGNKTITDTHEYSSLTVADVLQKSSNIGISHIALLMKPNELSNLLKEAGFTKKTLDVLPNSKGYLPSSNTWTPLQQATISFGHGLNVSLLQLAKAYTGIATGKIPEKLRLFTHQPSSTLQDFLSEKERLQLQQMLVRVTEKGGTAENAMVSGITVAGKTGTAHKLKNGHYVNDYIASFVGFGPINSYSIQEIPPYVIAVMIDSPTTNGHFGGTVAAPVFSKIMQYLVTHVNYINHVNQK